MAATTTTPPTSTISPTTMARPAVFCLPAELLTAVFEMLSTRDLAAAVRVCRLWTHVGSAVLWRSPPEAALRQLPAASRRSYGAAHVRELSLTSRSVRRIMSTPLPRLQRLHVSLTVVLANTPRFCRFVREHSGVASHSPCIGGGGDASTESSNQRRSSRRSRSSTTMAHLANAPIRLLASVRITINLLGRRRTLPTEAFIVLAHSQGLRELLCDANVTMEAMQAAIDGKGSGSGNSSAVTPSATSPLQQGHQPQELLQHHAQIFPNLRVLLITLPHPMVPLLLPHLRATIVTELRLFILESNEDSGAGGSTAALLRSVGRFTELCHLQLRMYDNNGNNDAAMVSARDILVLRALSNLRELRLVNVWTEQSDGVLLELLQGMPDITVLSLRPTSGLTAGIVPRIGVVCHKLEDLELETELDTGSLGAFAAQAPVLPNLARLLVALPANLHAINAMNANQMREEAQSVAAQLAAHAPKLPQSLRGLWYTSYTLFGIMVQRAMHLLGMTPAQRAAHEERRRRMLEKLRHRRAVIRAAIEATQGM